MKYRFGIIFNFGQHLKLHDPTNIFLDVDHEKLLREVMRFLTEDVVNRPEALERINEMEYLMGVLYDKHIVTEYLFHENESYAKVCAILFSICESLVELLLDTGFYNYCSSHEEDLPKVKHVSRKNYAILVSPNWN
jgi:hypothetical protein